jgi:hypothetical protein
VGVVVTTAFVVATFITVKLRGYKEMPHALRDAIAADLSFGALLLLHALLWPAICIELSVILAIALTPTTKAPRMMAAINVSPHL